MWWAMAKGKPFKLFEKSKKDVEKPGGPKEGSKREEAVDKKTMAKQKGKK